ncbi:MAG: hypothetical protein J7K21_06020 [Desulfurococcales archaeon]|nr:hypothetical protein [Desulfurococcales archaeon]
MGHIHVYRFKEVTLFSKEVNEQLCRKAKDFISKTRGYRKPGIKGSI